MMQSFKRTNANEQIASRHSVSGIACEVWANRVSGGRGEDPPTIELTTMGSSVTKHLESMVQVFDRQFFSQIFRDDDNGSRRSEARIGTVIDGIIIWIRWVLMHVIVKITKYYLLSTLLFSLSCQAISMQTNDHQEANCKYNFSTRQMSTLE